MRGPLRWIAVLLSLSTWVPHVAGAQEMHPVGTPAEKSSASCRWSTDFTVTGLDGPVLAIASEETVDGTRIYVGGEFAAADGNLVNHVAIWDLGGFFVDTLGDVSVRNIARWDGTHWSDPDPENSFSHGHVYGLNVSSFEGPELLYSAGDDGVTRFDGQSWSYVGPEDNPRTELSYAVTSWRDETSEHLYIGRYSYVQSPTWFLERWDGSEWSEFTGPGGSGPNDRALALHTPTREQSLWVGGDSTRVGDLPSSGIARWTCESPCSDAPDQRLCLSGQDRFLIEIEWRDFDGNEGRGRVVPFQTGDSGLFYFFDADNWEMLVKVLDACGYNDHFWVFSAATTNVESTLTVTDTFTGKKKRYFNPLGTAAPAVTDTAAFATCDASVTSSASSASSFSTSLTDEGIAKSRRVNQVDEKMDCVPSDTTMCLDGGRFALEVDWRDFDGDVGPGHVVQGTPSDDSGLFQFFGEDNWEVLVKVLDACGFNDRFWVFSAATTNVEYTLHVTDTETGESVSYFNPLGNAADAVTDTDAFSSCP